MTNQEHRAQTILAIDFGAATTRANLFDVVEGVYRHIATGEAPSTFGALTVHLWPRTGRHRPAVLAYSAVLLACALQALRSRSAATALGGGLFLASDSLLALERFSGRRLPAHEAWVMSTYTAAQALLAEGGPRHGPADR